MSKFAFLDLNYTDPIFEKYNIVNCHKYGGWCSVFSYFKEFSNCFLISRSESFSEIDSTKESRNSLIEINKWQSDYIKLGNPIKDVIPDAHTFDLIIHPHVNQYFNLDGLKAKQVAIDLGVYQEIQENHKYIIQYSKEQFSKIPDKEVKIAYFQLGVPIEPVFKPAPKEDYIFSCSRICSLMSSIEVSNFCRNNNIKGYFAGPIYNDYSFLDTIDNINTFYLGEISNVDKINYIKKARLCSTIIQWQSPFSLFALESLSNGTPIVHVPLGNWWSTIIKEGVNGFACTNYNDLLNAWNNSKNINPMDCYLSSLKYNHHTMLDTLFKALEEIYKCN